MSDDTIPNATSPEEVMTTEKRDAEIVPVAAAIIKAIANREDLVKILASRKGEEEAAAKIMQDIYVEIVAPLLLEANLRYNDIPYLFQIVMQPFQLASSLAVTSMEVNRDLSDAKLYGLKDIDNLRMVHIDTALKSGDNNEGSVKA